MKRLLIALALGIATTTATMAREVEGYRVDNSIPSSGMILFNVNSVDFRPDLTRVYGTLNGRPHTSNRIDRLVLVTPTGKQFEATDIEGVDFKRWFQWEDSGKIEVEIDFPAMTEVNRFTLKAQGPKGESSNAVILTK
ncbi:MAG: hypothetical protein NC338_08330 [Firmicutes bacterium]|nr:hypothetical protein [Bacillota bacterium]MCM1402002.1 hypothetical protein [Bacteroides sp.]MCM1476893.1 hypothetical protein [Bacteroides sp.]